MKEKSHSKKVTKHACNLKTLGAVMRSDQSWNQKYLKHFVRNYDIWRIREERMLQSFTIGSNNLSPYFILIMIPSSLKMQVAITL